MNKIKPKPAKSKTRSLKTTLFSISITAILGFWTLFSRQASQAANNDPSLSNKLVLDLPPIPTLIAPIEHPETSRTTGQPGVTPTPAAPSSNVFLMGGAQPSNGFSLGSGSNGGGGGRQPAPVASSGSSK